MLSRLNRRYFSTLEQTIRDRLQSLQPQHLTIVDENPQSPRGSYSYVRLEVVSEQFEGKSHLEKHQMVYALLEKEMRQIHALTMRCRAPSEITKA